MQVVFTASHSQRDKFGEYYKKILKVLEDGGHKIFTGALFDAERYESLDSKEGREKWYKEVIKKIKESDLVVLEMSYPSTANIGHLLTYALEAGKPVIALHKKGSDPMFMRGMVDERFVILAYDDGDLESTLKDGLDYVTEIQDVRFNFFISPKIGSYLDWISKNQRVPRAVYLRRLIEKDMNSNEEYNK